LLKPAHIASPPSLLKHNTHFNLRLRRFGQLLLTLISTLSSTIMLAEVCVVLMYRLPSEMHFSAGKFTLSFAGCGDAAATCSGQSSLGNISTSDGRGTKTSSAGAACCNISVISQLEPQRSVSFQMRHADITSGAARSSLLLLAPVAAVVAAVLRGRLLPRRSSESAMLSDM
jgi:hypothetical protein